MFSAILKKLRIKYGMTQKQLADRIGVEKSSIAKYESGKGVMPSDDIKLKIADVFNVSLDCLFGRETPDESNAVNIEDDEMSIILNYRTLCDDDKKTVIRIIDALSSKSDNKSNNVEQTKIG